MHNTIFVLSLILTRTCSLQTYGAQVDQLRAELGGTVPEQDVVAALVSHTYKLVTITHVDTSTGVLSDIKRISELVRDRSPDTLVRKLLPLLIFHLPNVTFL